VTEEGVKRVQAATGRINAASASKSASSSDWAVRKKFSLSEQSSANFKWAAGSPPIQARAMVLADKTLFVAGPPDVVDEEEAFAKPDDAAVRARLEAQVAALEGRKGGQLLAVSAIDGKILAAVELGAAPTFDGMAAAKGRLYLTTLDGKVLCLGGEGTALPAAPQARLVALDISLKVTAPEPLPGAATGPSAAGEFAKVAQARVTRSPLGYSLHADSKQMGLALKKLPTPATGKVSLKMRMKLRTDGKLKNAFLVFGDSPDDAALVKCGLRSAQKKAVIVEGPLTGGKTTAETLDFDTAKTYEIDVTVDLASGQVTMKTGGVTVTATIERRPANISYVGCGTLDGAADFSAVEVSSR
jgi:hypothetical protein